MKRLCLPLLLVLCLLLTGCGGRAEREKYREFSDELSSAQALSFVSDVRCEYEDRSLDFRLSFEGEPGLCTVEVLEPEIIHGIKAQLKAGGSALEYEDIILDTGDLDSYGLTPMSALPCLAEAMAEGHPEVFWNEDGLFVCELSLNEHLRAVVRFNPGSMIPADAELISDGSVKVFCKIENWNQ